jgi:predicted DNA-binding transcriptional regulator AlpA
VAGKRSTKQQAERIGLAPKTLDNWRSAGQGPPYYKLGNRVVYDDDEVDAWLAERRRTSTAEPSPSPAA